MNIVHELTYLGRITRARGVRDQLTLGAERDPEEAMPSSK